MNIFINGKQYKAKKNVTLADVKAKYCPDKDVAILNSVLSLNGSKKIVEGDRLYFFGKEDMPTDEELEELLFSRQPFAITEKLKKACIGIAGAGGLGTVVAESLSRAGIGKIVIADFDIVEPSNLNRQHFFISQLGMAKVYALADNIKQFNPFTKVVQVREKVTASNCGRIFAGCSVVAECFDDPANKAEIVFGLRKSLPQCYVVAASGLAGTGCGNDIKTRKISDKFFVVGDMKSEVADGSGLFASRVGIAASMQTHIIIRLITGNEK